MRRGYTKGVDNMAVKTYKKGDTTKLSKNFSVNEFQCKGSGCCSTVLIDDQLVKYLQQIRDHFGASVTITSAYRCSIHNSRVNGATGSRHTKGQACDIVVAGVAPAKVAAYAESIGIKGIGLYETAKDGFFVHIDTRTTKSFWYGQAQAYRSTFGGAAAATVTKPTTTTTSGTYTQKQFVMDVQKAIGAAVDGVAGWETIGKTVTLSEKRNISHAAVLAVQKRLIALGYTQVGQADGVAGEKFTKAVKAYQAANGCVSDGEITAEGKTWKKLLGAIV